MKSSILDEANRTFRPEFINRLDEMIVFRPLNRENMLTIVGIMLREVISRLSEKGVELSAGEEVRSFLLQKGYQPKYGARPLRRTIQTCVEDRLADYLLGSGEAWGDKIEAYIDGEEIKFRSGAAHNAG